VWDDLIGLPHRRIPGELTPIAGVVVARAVGHQHHDDAAVALHLGHPKLALEAIRLAVAIGPEGVVVFSAGVVFHPALVRVALQGRGQHAGVQDLLAADCAAVCAQEVADFRQVVGDPPHPVSAHGLTLPVIVFGTQGGEDAWTHLQRDVDLVHHELEDVGVGAFQGTQVVVQRARNDEGVKGAVHPLGSGVGAVWPVEGSRNSFCVIFFNPERVAVPVLLIHHESRRLVVSRRHVEHVVKGDGAPIAVAGGGFGDVIFDQQPGRGGIVFLRQAHQRHTDESGLGRRIGRGAHVLAVGILPIAGLAAAHVVDPVDHEAIPGPVLGGDAAPESGDIHPRVVFSQLLDGFCGETVDQFLGEGVPELVCVRYGAGVVVRIQQAPQIRAERDGRLLRDLVPDLRYALVVEEEGHRAVEGGVGSLPDQRKGEGGAGVALVTALLPDAARFEDIVPVGVVSDDQAALHGDEVAILALHELKVELGQVWHFRLHVGVASQHGHLTGDVFTMQLQAALEGVTRGRGVCREAEGGFIHGGSVIEAVHQVVVGQQGAGDVPCSGQRGGQVGDIRGRDGHRRGFGSAAGSGQNENDHQWD